jgi:CelD/BcsL family acetyltransferase involved in cellulose biosynthesis
MNRLVTSSSLRADDAAPAVAVRVESGLSGCIDRLSEAVVPGRRFLRRAWYRAALETYHGGAEARTLVAQRGGEPLAALPVVPGRIAAVPGSYWPFRSFPVADGCSAEDMAALLAAPGARRVLGHVWRLGPVYEDDPALALLLAAAPLAGWSPIGREITRWFLLDIEALREDGKWPRTSTLQKNRYFERKLAARGELDWSFASGADWNAELFDRLAGVEAKSWVVTDGDGSDAKFYRSRHRAFWENAATDPVLAGQMTAALLRVDGEPAAFSFDLDDGPHKFIIANGFDGGFSKQAPGRLLAYRNFARGMEKNGLACVDWGAGDSGYKSQAGAEPAGAIRDYLFVRGPVLRAAAPLLRRLWARGATPVA